MPLEIGDVAPPFRLRDKDGIERTLAEHKHAERALKACKELLS